MSGTRTAHIDLDPTNPGEVLACLGFFDLVAERDPDARGGFPDKARGGDGRARFEFSGSAHGWIDDWATLLRGVEVEAVDFSGERAIAPIRLTGLGAPRELDWWLEPARTEGSWLKLWAGRVTSLQLLRDCVSALKNPMLDLSTVPSLLQQSMPMGSTFGFDPRGGWVSLDVGYSPNDIHQPVERFPVVELLGAVGLQHFRPEPTDRRRRGYRYFLWSDPLPASVARAAFADALEGLEGCRYEFAVRNSGSFKLFDRSTPVEGG